MKAVQEILFSRGRKPEFFSGRPIGRKLGAGKQADVYEYGDEEVMKILQPHWRMTNVIGGDWQAQLGPRLIVQQHYIGSFLPESRVEKDTLFTGEEIIFIVQEKLDEKEMKKMKYVSWGELADQKSIGSLTNPTILNQLDVFTKGALQMIDETGCTPDLSGNNESFSGHFDLKRSENLWIHKERGLLLLDVVNPGPYYMANNPLGEGYVTGMRNAIVNFRKQLGFDMHPIVAG